MVRTHYKEASGQRKVIVHQSCGGEWGSEKDQLRQRSLVHGGDTALPGCWTFLLRAGQCGGGARQYLVFGTFTLDSWYLVLDVCCLVFGTWYLVINA